MPSLYAIYSRYSDILKPSARIETGTDTNDANYAPEMLFDDNPAKVAKIDSTTGAWEIDSGGSPLTKLRIDYAALIHHTFMAGCDVKIQGSDAPNWAGSPVTAPEFEASFTIPAWKGSGITRYPVNAGLDLTQAAGYSATGFFYWRLLITGNDQNVQLGQLVLLSQIRRLSPHIQWEYVVTNQKRIIENRTDFGVSTFYRRMVTQRILEGRLRADEDLDVDLDAHWYDVDGRGFPFLFVPFFPSLSSDDIDAYNEPLLVRFAENLRAMTHTIWDVRDQRWLLEEVARGLRPGN